MAELTWTVLQRLCDDEPPLKVWREERAMEPATLAEQTGIPLDRLGKLETDMHLATDSEVDRLALALRVPFEFLAVPHLTAAA